jgi:glycosyltransferase involved in cell wall biosynthesis
MDGWWLSAGVFGAVLFILLRVHFGLKQVRQLSEIGDEIAPDAPRVSIIVSALNEADTIEPALRSLMALDYPRLELIAIDDRSTDATGAILDRLADEDPRLRVLHITELPPGWLGKTHALQRGGEAASGDYLLFTDADVIFEPRALRRAVAYCEEHRLDHLVVMAEFLVDNPLLASLLLNFLAFGFTTHPPWKLRTSKDVYLGMGAFNMVRADAYRQAGGHTTLRLEVVDDIMLGKRMKDHGFRQDALLGLKTVSLVWYRDAGELMRGLEKNSYAMVDYSIARLVAATVAVLVARYWPIVGLFVTSGSAWWLNVGALAANLLLHVELIRTTRWSARCFWWWVLSPALMLGILWRAVILTRRRGGVNWRGTLYSLEDLKRAHSG